MSFRGPRKSVRPRETEADKIAFDIRAGEVTIRPMIELFDDHDADGCGWCGWEDEDLADDLETVDLRIGT